ncbi:hypothetical protein RchiOBHm_Chr7g0224321 [Rosa chinensis]|uniref:Uncharacterized protein n=1 Tax=Rosa chinensis TaxID=74649 RepID=A0A2P6PDS8_ROSCH|nr:hypothetical protein RchiOBHm_Chr7g0224321 [Rosa chinensis]
MAFKSPIYMSGMDVCVFNGHIKMAEWNHEKEGEEGLGLGLFWIAHDTIHLEFRNAAIMSSGKSMRRCNHNSCRE